MGQTLKEKVKLVQSRWQSRGGFKSQPAAEHKSSFCCGGYQLIFYVLCVVLPFIMQLSENRIKTICLLPLQLLYHFIHKRRQLTNFGLMVVLQLAIKPEDWITMFIFEWKR